LGASANDLRYGDTIEATLDDLAAHIEQHLDLDATLKLAAQV